MRGGEHLRKQWVTILILSVVLIILIPWTILRWQDGNKGREDFSVRVKMPNGQVEKLPLEEYLVGVVAAEMPAEFDTEALKAQAVTARTYVAKRLSQKLISDAGFDVDTTVATQAWISKEEMYDKWGFLGFWRYHGRIEKAVTSTEGQVLVYGGQYIDAFYHSSTGRKLTERAEDVWSSSRPYLQNVASGEKEPNRYLKTYSFTPNTLYPKLGVPGTPKAFTGADFVVLSQTATGRAKSIRVLGKNYSGAQLRSILGLASTDFEIIINPGELQIKTYGNGHGVGMSQYGANDLGKSGKSYKDILEHFYPGAKMLSLSKGT
jgi:stage II sporulation protein D